MLDSLAERVLNVLFCVIGCSLQLQHLSSADAGLSLVLRQRVHSYPCTLVPGSKHQRWTAGDWDPLASAA